MDKPQLLLLLGTMIVCAGIYSILINRNPVRVLFSVSYIVLGLEIDTISLTIYGFISANGYIFGVVLLTLFLIQLSAVFGVIFYRHGKESN